MKLSERLIILLFLVGLIPVGLGFLGKFHWIADLFSHFRLIYIIYFYSIGFILLLARSIKTGLLSILIALLLTAPLIHFYSPKPPITSSNANTLSIASINLLSSNSNYSEVLEYVTKNNFDIVFLMELNHQWQLQFEDLNSYEHTYFLPRSDNFGIGVISKVELDSIQVIDLSDANLPSLLVSISKESETLSMLATHPLPPIGRRFFESRNLQFENINRFVSTIETEIILIGDLNSTTFSPNFKRLTRENDLIDTRIGFGILPTWNDLFGINLLTLDHALATPGVYVLRRSVGKSIGSDHLPIEVEIGF
ncbi:MAG: endonuclease/exonuclease/phosphatase family protein [bacterium]|nr:endonuclease/exonuclease/phosphatase family protein [bacterium]